jgi:hypothetical protein
VGAARRTEKVSVLQFIASLVASLAWPVLVVVALLIFRKPLIGLIARATDIQLFGATVRLGKEIQRAAVSTEAAVASAQSRRDLTEVPKSRPRAEGKNPWLATLSESPSLAAIYAWAGLEKSLRKLGSAFGDSTPSSASVTDLLAGLEKNSVLEPEFVRAAHDLRLIRNRIAYGTATITEAEGLSFINSAWQLGQLADQLVAAHGAVAKPATPTTRS